MSPRDMTTPELLRHAAHALDSHSAAQDVDGAITTQELAAALRARADAAVDPENKPASLPVFPRRRAIACDDVSLDAPDDNHAPIEVGPTVFAITLDRAAEPRAVTGINRGCHVLGCKSCDAPSLVDELDEELDAVRKRAQAAEAELLAWLAWARELATYLDAPWQSHTQPGPLRSRIDERVEQLRDIEQRLDGMKRQLAQFFLRGAQLRLVEQRDPAAAAELDATLADGFDEDLRDVLAEVSGKLEELGLSRDRLRL